MITKYKEHLLKQERHCYKCEHFYEGTICGFEISADENETFEEIKAKRACICTYDKE